MNRGRPLASVLRSPRGLKVAFVTLGVVLLGGLGILGWLVQERIAAAQRDREEMVASRVFDEMEREISAFLEGEADRPHYIDLENTNPEAWAPFVVGYFSAPRSHSSDLAQIVAAEGKTSENRRRVAWALGQAEATWTTSELPAPSSPEWVHPPQFEQRALPKPGAAVPPRGKSTETPAPAQQAPVLQQQKAKGSDIIETLNRAPERRRSKPSSKEDAGSNDQFLDYTESY